MRALTIFVLTLLGVSGAFQDAAMAQDKDKQVAVTTKYDIYLSEYTDSAEVRANNNKVRQASGQQRSLWSALLSIYAPGLVSQTTSATTSVIGLLIESMKGERKDWLQAAQQQCTFTKSLAQMEKKDDFYCLPSTNGALDPSNIKFKGFGCRCYKECTDDSLRGQGVEEFRVYCKLRTDDEGIANIVNHSKFLVEIDTLMFDPFHCMLPYDTITRSQIMPFDFDKRKDLTFQLNVKFYSSWINEAIMVTTDQLLGEFCVKASIKKENLNQDSIFVYSAASDSLLLKEGVVEVSGDCFLVPRSFTGTPDGTTAGRAWGTGQYRVEMTVTETCQIDNKKYYKDDAQGDSEDWDKNKWNPEWQTIKKKRNASNLLKDIGNTVVSTFRGTDGWVQMLTEPVITTISESEADVLNGFLGVESTSSTSTMGM